MREKTKNMLQAGGFSLFLLVASFALMWVILVFMEPYHDKVTDAAVPFATTRFIVISVLGMICMLTTGGYSRIIYPYAFCIGAFVAYGLYSRFTLSTYVSGEELETLRKFIVLTYMSFMGMVVLGGYRAYMALFPEQAVEK